MLPPARPARPSRLDVGAPSILVVALLGAWLSHNLEYLRVGGARGFAGVALHSAHLYMGPMGVALVAGAAVGVQSTLRLARRLERLLGELCHPASPPMGPAGGGAGWSFAVPTLVVVVWLLQSGLYLLQENAEAWLAHAPVPGPGALSGGHALAPLVHLAVTLALVTALCLLRRRVTVLAAAVWAVAAALRAWRPVAPVPAPPPLRSWTPAQRWGRQRWCRPPPVAFGS